MLATSRLARSVLESEVLTRAPAILAQYPLVRPGLLGELGGSTRNENLLVEDGARRRYVLRRHRKHVDSTFIDFTLEFQRYLVESGFPTPRVILTTQGDLSVGSADGRWSLSEFVDGDHFQFDRFDQIAEAGRRLAEFHQLGQAFSGSVVEDDVSDNARLWWTQGDRELGQIGARYSGLDVELAHLRRWSEETFRTWPLERLDALPGGIVHLDWHGRNMVFVEHRVVGVFDFDGLSRGFLAEDVAYGMLMFGRGKRGSLDIRMDASRTFLHAYEDLRSLSAEERAAIPMFLTSPGAPIYTWMVMLERIGLDPVRHLAAKVAQLLKLRGDLTHLLAIVAPE